jgi:hypothetical protein
MKVVRVSGDDAVSHPQFIAIYYQWNSLRGVSAHEFRNLLPEDEAGRVKWPFVVPGSPTTEDEIAAALPREQLNAVRAFRFTRADRQAARELASTSGLKQQTTSGMPIQRLLCTAYAFDDKGNPVREIPSGVLGSTENGQTWRFPPGCTIILIPDEQPRPGGDHAGAIAKAVVLTPLTLTFDVLSLPIGLILFATGNLPC